MNPSILGVIGKSPPNMVRLDRLISLVGHVTLLAVTEILMLAAHAFFIVCGMQLLSRLISESGFSKPWPEIGLIEVASLLPCWAFMVVRC